MREIEGAERDALLVKILRGIETAQQVGPHRHGMWERAWSEPKPAVQYAANADGVCRIDGKLYHAPGHEAAHLKKLLHGVALRHMDGIECMREYGCGQGHNLEFMTARKDVRGIGYDWAQSAVDAVRGRGMEAYTFDMFNPPMAEWDRPHLALTVHALEQLGGDCWPMLEYLMASRPTVCVHIEPVYELYDPHNLLDRLAMLYHKKRSYLIGFLPMLQELEKAGRVEILEARRTYVGSLFHEAYSVVCWRLC